MSLKSRLLSYLQRNYPRRVSGIELERLALEAGYKSSNCGRRCREMEVAGNILATYEKGFVSYQYKPVDTLDRFRIRFTPAPVCPLGKIQTRLI